jgi:type IV pilus assembly protein PilW
MKPALVHAPVAPARNGFSLVELLVTLSVLAMVVAMVSGVLVSSNKTQLRTTTRAELQAETRQALSLLTTEVRQAGADPGIPPAGITGIVTADSTTLRVRADLNANGTIQTTEPSEDVTYTYNAGSKSLLRNPGAGAATLLSNVTSIRYTYFDSNDQPLTPLPLSATNRALVHTVNVTLTCEYRDSQPYTLTTRMTLRNQ